MEGTDSLNDAAREETLVDGDHIGGYLWKFPSEGSNASPGGGDDVEHCDTASYPRKCRYCAAVWVSSYVNERRHWKQCAPSASHSTDENGGEMRPSCPSLGVARRVWCEIDSALTAIQWREDVEAEQDLALCCVAFADLEEVALLGSDASCFRITTTGGRRVVFQWRDEAVTSDDTRAVTVQRRCLDAKQWCEYLEMFRRFSQSEDLQDVHQVQTHQHRLPSVNENESSELLGEITRAIAAQDVAALEELLQEEDLSSAKTLLDDNGSSLLVVAFKLGGNEAVIKALVRAGVDCNAQNAEGETPLLLAAASGDADLVKVLLRVAAIDVNMRCAMGATAFHAAANAGDVDVLRLLCEHGVTVTTAVDDNGWTALHYAAACASGCKAMRFLCELIPELVDAQCGQSNTALHVAAGCGCVENAQVLLETAANPHVLNGDGHTPYHVAMHNNHIACALAIHEYMDTPRDVYEYTTATAVSKKEDYVGQPETTYGDDWGGGHHNAASHYIHDQGYGWVECVTEEQVPYYYNTKTGESTWYKPTALETDRSMPPPPPPTASKFRSRHHRYSDQDFGSSTSSESEEPKVQKLPLCMIPLVSPLVTLDHPTAATKLDLRRKKDRERRRRTRKTQQLRAQSVDDALYQQQPPPPPPPFRLASH